MSARGWLIPAVNLLMVRSSALFLLLSDIFPVLYNFDLGWDRWVGGPLI
jgi:hypothetical protein